MRFLLLMLLALLSGCRFETAPSDRIETGKFVVVTEHNGCPYFLCDNYEESTVRHGWTWLDKDFYERALGVAEPYGITPSHFVLLPRRGVLLGLLHSGASWMLVEFQTVDGKPRLAPVIGCWMNGENSVTANATIPGPCPADVPFFFGGAVYSHRDVFSYHGGFWIDYKREAVHELHPSMETHEMIQVVGPTRDRSALLLVYRKYLEKGSYLLCGLRSGQRAALEQCVAFTKSDEDEMPWDRPLDGPFASAPVPSAHLILRDLDKLEGAQAWRSWLGERFELDLLGLDGRPLKVSERVYRAGAAAASPSTSGPAPAGL